MGWLELRAHGDVDAIETPIGFIPQYEDLKKLFNKIDKEYPYELYEKQFSLYLDNILERIHLQKEAYSQERGVPWRLFEIYDEQRIALEAFKEKYGPVVTVKQLISEAP